MLSPKEIDALFAAYGLRFVPSYLAEDPADAAAMAATKPMVLRPGAIELCAGLVEDPVFGPLVAFGQGGITVEATNGTSLELRARINKQLVDGTVRAAIEHVRDLEQAVEVSKT